MVDHVGGSGSWQKDIRNRIILRRGGTKPGGKKNSQEKKKDSQETTPGACASRAVRGFLHLPFEVSDLRSVSYFDDLHKAKDESFIERAWDARTQMRLPACMPGVLMGCV